MGDFKRRLTISVPVDVIYIPFVCDFVRRASVMAGFDESDAGKIELAVEEAASNVISHGFAMGEEESFEVIAEPSSLGIKIILKEMGEPFDPSQIPQYDPEVLRTDLSGRGLGVYLMRKVMDEVSFHNLGRGGKETHLFKYFGAAFPGPEGPDAVSRESETKEAVSEAPGGTVSYTIRRMVLEEAVEVSRCAYSSYSYSYAIDDIYFPDRVRELNESGKLISHVAVTDGGEIVGHGGLKTGDQHGVAECGVIFVKPKFRGQGCMNSLMKALIGDGRRKGLSGLSAQAVTSHPFSQKALYKFGFRDCCLLLSRADPMKFRQISTGKDKRESLICSFLYLTRPSGKMIFPPARHSEMIIALYEELGAPPLSAVRDIGLPENDSSLRVTTDPYNAATIEILEYGRNAVSEVKKNLRALCVDRIETVYLHLDLGSPLTGRLAAEFEDLGFFFAGINPGMGKDTLVLQYLNNLQMDYDSLQLASETGQRLARYIRHLDPNLRL